MYIKKTLIFILLLSSIFIVSSCTKLTEQVENIPPEAENTKTKSAITKILAANAEITDITWSPDDTRVVYLQKGQAEKSVIKEAYLWQVNAEEAKLIREVAISNLGFSWSPNGQYFLISEKISDNIISSIFVADTKEEATYQVKSNEVPIWSADSLFLAYGFEQHDYGTSWGSLKVYELGQTKDEYIWNAPNYLYHVEFWDADGNIGYKETDSRGKESNKTTKNIRPSISGVHIGDTKEQVIVALGKDYKETQPAEDTMTFPEPVYRLTYTNGYDVFIGKDSGGVIEIMATYTEAETNLGVKIGDKAEKVFAIYRPKYIEPESIHGGKLYGVFKVEGATAIFFRFNLAEGVMLGDIKPENVVVSIDLTYPNVWDDDF